MILLGIDYTAALNYLNIQTLRERRERHCVDLIANISVPWHRLHNLLAERFGEIRQRETSRSKVNMC